MNNGSLKKTELLQTRGIKFSQPRAKKKKKKAKNLNA
jgi:hypothetical protein